MRKRDITLILIMIIAAVIVAILPPVEKIDKEIWPNKLIDQAFEKISENIAYQEKVNAIEKILHSRGRNYA